MLAKRSSSVRWLTIFVCLVLVACGAEPVAVEPTPTPTPLPPPPTPIVETPVVETPTASATSTATLPTATAEPTSTATAVTGNETALPATAEPTDAPTVAVDEGILLPAPLYYLTDGRVWQLDRDGQTTIAITNEAITIAEFAVSPWEGTFAYVQLSQQGDTTLATLLLANPDGTPAGVPLSAPETTISALRWSPVAPLLIYRVSSLTPSEPAVPPGTYIVDTTGAAQPRPYILDAPLTDPSGDENPPLYVPLEWSPNGRQLLLAEFMFETAALAVAPFPAGPPVQLNQADDIPLPCCDASWSRDGSAVYVATNGDLGLGTITPGLWKANPTTGTAETMVQGAAGGLYATMAFPRQLADGQIYYFAATTTAAPVAGEGTLRLNMYRLADDERELPGAMRSDSYLLAEVLWADDASGAVVLTEDDDTEPAQLLWLPVSGDPVPLPVVGTNLRWGPTESARTPNS